MNDQPAIESKQLPVLTASSSKDGRACMRLFHLRDELGYRPVKVDDVLYFGTLFHLGLEAWWKAKKELLPDDEVLLAALHALQQDPTVDPFELAKAEVLITGYHLRWKDEPYDVLHVEAEFRIPLVNPATGAKSRTWQLGGKIDVIVRDRRTGLVYLIEHKTSSEDITVGSDYWKRLRLDGQVSIYFDGGQSIIGDEQIAGCIYDVVLKPTQRPSETIPVLDEEGRKIVRNAQGERVRNKDGKSWRQTASKEDGFVLEVRNETPEEYQLRITEAVTEAPDKYFARGEVVRLDGELDEFRFDTWQIARSIREYQLVGRHPRNPDACVRYGKTCAFFDVCTGAASLEDRTRFLKLENLNPELAQPAPHQQ